MVDANEIRERARELLEQGEVGSVLGYRAGDAGAEAVPAFIGAPEEVDSLVWDPTCMNNLALYLVHEMKRRAADPEAKAGPVAIVAKGCDARAVVVLLQENYFARDDVYIMGVSCEGTGVIDPRKLSRLTEGAVIKRVAFNGGDEFVVTTATGEESLDAVQVLADRCLECEVAYPEENNVLLGETPTRDMRARFTAAAAAEEWSEEQKWAFWQHQFQRCLRCYACRSVCPMCYCEECIVDSIEFAVTPETTAEEKANRIKWIERSAVTSESMGYHMVRAMHLAGRCIDCGECERVCPVNIPLRLLNTKLEKESREAFDYRPGRDLEQPSLLASFRDDDPNDFIR